MEGPGTRRCQPGQPVEPGVGQPRLHQERGGRTDLSRQHPTALAGPKRPRDRLWGQTIRLGHPRAGTWGARVRGPQRLVAGLEAPLLAPAAPPASLAHEATRRRVTRLLAADRTVALEVDLRAEGQGVGHGRPGLELGALDRRNAGKRRVFRRPMDPLAGGRQAPAPDVPLGLRDQRRCPAAQDVAFHVVHPAWLDLALVFGSPRTAGGAQKAVGLSTFPGGALDLRVVNAGLHDPRVEMVAHHPVGHPTHHGARRAMALHPGRPRRIADTRHLLLPAIGQDQHQGPGLAERPGGRINHAARLATIDLGFAPRLACHAPGGWWAMGLELVDKPVEGRSAPHHTCPLKVSRGPWSSWAPLRNSGMTGDSNSLIPHLQAQKGLSGQLCLLECQGILLFVPVEG